MCEWRCVPALWAPALASDSMRLLPLLLGAAAADSNLWLKGEESVIRFGERALLSARCLCDEPNVTCNATAPPTPVAAPEATVLFYTPQVVAQSQLGSENVRAFVQECGSQNVET